LTCDITKSTDAIKDGIFNSLEIYRIYLKKPESKEHEKRPLVFLHSPAVYEILERLNMNKDRLIKAIVFGKSVKFNGQVVSIEHKLLDKDIVEFYFKKF